MPSAHYPTLKKNIMKKTLQALIPTARQAIKDIGIPKNGDQVPSIFNGYISSFGASIVQAGLLPTVIFFENESSGADDDRGKICKAIYLLLERENNPTLSVSNLKKPHFHQHLLEKDRFQDPQLLKKVTNYAVALKIALRTFKLV